MNPLEKYIASCSPEITNILDNYRKRLEAEYQDMDVATFGDEYLNKKKRRTTKKRNGSNR
ncbi:MAG TPA: hypothetical protein VKA09_12135 [Nitrososphaeraceae archaeon]|nr:hypothetical protein [Nitrososphaeraceae archaeon]